ncbi:MAG: hypothetical protein ABII90_14255 [Bacteroidota bacterium]
MDLLKVYILFAIVILSFIVALITSLGQTNKLLAEEKDRNLTSVRKLNAVYIFIIFFMVILLLLIIKDFYQGPMITLTNKDNYKVTIKEKIEKINVKDISSDDQRKMYTDELEKFCFILPSDTGWSKPRIMSGLRAYLEKTGLETNKANIESFLNWNPYTEMLQCVFSDLRLKPYDDILDCLDKSLTESPYGKMLKLSLLTQTEYGKSVKIKIKNRYTSPFFVFEHKNQTVNSTLDSIPALPGQNAPFTDEYATLNFTNYFNVVVLDKTKIKKDDNKLTLANYFLNNTINFASNLENIIASENNILFTSSFNFENAILFQSHNPNMEKKPLDLRIYRWVRMIEEPDLLYIIEMAYSPETDITSNIWSDLKTMFESFALLSPLH